MLLMEICAKARLPVSAPVPLIRCGGGGPDVTSVPLALGVAVAVVPFSVTVAPVLETVCDDVRIGSPETPAPIAVCPDDATEGTVPA